MAKTCYDCKHIEYNGCAEPGEVSGWQCAKREPKTIEEERAFSLNFGNEAYRNRYKRCFEPVKAAGQPDGEVG